MMDNLDSRVLMGRDCLKIRKRRGMKDYLLMGYLHLGLSLNLPDRTKLAINFQEIFVIRN